MFKLWFATIVVLLLSAISNQTGDKDKPVIRYGVESDIKRFPQNTPKDALASVLKAIGEKRIDYLLAHLTDPAFVDKQVTVAMSQLGPNVKDAQKKSLAFDRVVKTIADNFQADPSKLPELQRFYKDGEWQEDGNNAVAQLMGLNARKVFMKQIPPDRWVLLDREK